MNKIVMEVTDVSSTKHENVKMDDKTHEALKVLGLITQTVTLKPVDRNKSNGRDNEVHYDPIKITLHGDELRLGDQFVLELTPVR